MSTEVKKLNLLNKLMLLQVRRFKKYKNIPKTLSIFDWQEAKRRAWNQYKLIGTGLLIYIMIDVTNYMRGRRLAISEELYRDRRARNLADYPLYDVWGENPEFDAYRTDFLMEKHDSLRDLRF